MNSVKSQTDISGSEEAIEETTTFDWTDRDAVITAIVCTVASATGADPRELQPLAEVVETDALERLFKDTDSVAEACGYLQFEYEGCLVQVTADGEVRASPVP